MTETIQVAIIGSCTSIALALIQIYGQRRAAVVQAHDSAGGIRATPKQGFLRYIPAITVLCLALAIAAVLTSLLASRNRQIIRMGTTGLGISPEKKDWSDTGGTFVFRCPPVIFSERGPGMPTVVTALQGIGLPNAVGIHNYKVDPEILPDGSGFVPTVSIWSGGWEGIEKPSSINIAWFARWGQ